MLNKSTTRAGIIMTDSLLKKDPQHIIEQNLRERMASLEATNNFHRETLHEISSSLKEVVKTQHVLANQRDEILKLVKTVSEVQQNMAVYNQETFELKFQVRSNAELVKTLQTQYLAVKKDADNNTHFVKLLTKIFSVIMVPVILSIILQYIG